MTHKHHSSGRGGTLQKEGGTVKSAMPNILARGEEHRKTEEGTDQKR